MFKNRKIDNDDKGKQARKIADRSIQNSTIYETLVSLILRVYRWFSVAVDNLILNSSHLFTTSFVIAILFYLGIAYSSQDSVFSSNLVSAKELSGVSVSSRYNAESFEISGVPTSCDVTLMGDASSVNNSATKKGYCLVDLSGLTEGTHTIKLSAEGYGDSVATRITPTSANITLKKKTTSQFDVSYDFINTDKIDSRYILGTPVFETTRVNIRASQDTLDSISFVKALIDVTGVNEDFTKDATLVAYNKNGQPVNADIVPNTINCSVRVTAPSKNVPITLEIAGELPDNLAIEKASMDYQSVEIYGSEANLASITNVTVNLDASTLTKDTKVVAPIVLPLNVTGSDISMVNLDITVGEKSEKRVDNIPVNVLNYASNFDIKVLDGDSYVSYIATGTESNVQECKEADIYAYIDLADIGVGTHTLTIDFNKTKDSKQYVNYSLVQNTITIVVSERGNQ